MIGVYNKVENISYVVMGFEQTPTRLPEGLPWAIVPSKEMFKRLFDDFVEGMSVSHMETTIGIQETLLRRRLRDLPGETHLTEEGRKRRKQTIDTQLLRFRSMKQSTTLGLKSQLLKLSESPEIPKLLKINRFYVTRIRGIYSTDLRTFMSNSIDGDFLGETTRISFVEILIKFLNLYLTSYPWRMENYAELQKFIFRLKDVQLGLTADYRYVTDMLCPKLYALVDRDSVSYTNLSVKLEENNITSTVEMNTFEERVVVEKREGVEWSFPPMQVVETEKPEGVSLIYTDQRWKSEAWVILPLIINFFTFIPGSHPELKNGADLFEKTIRDLVDSHICPSIGKVGELVDYCFGHVLFDYREIFTTIIHTVLYSPEEAVKVDFDADVRAILGILIQYVQAL